MTSVLNLLSDHWTLLFFPSKQHALASSQQPHVESTLPRSVSRHHASHLGMKTVDFSAPFQPSKQTLFKLRFISRLLLAIKLKRLVPVHAAFWSSFLWVFSQPSALAGPWFAIDSRLFPAVSSSSPSPIFAFDLLSPLSWSCYYFLAWKPWT